MSKKNKNKQEKNKNSQEFAFDPQGSYTGKTPHNSRPIQDADDL